MSRRTPTRSPVFLLALLTLALLWDASGFIKLSLLCALLHEAGHFFVFWLLTKRPPRISCSLVGFHLEMDGVFLRPRSENLLLAAGPAANLLAAAAGWAFVCRRASYLGYFFLCENLCMALFNLLPVHFLDGGRLAANLIGPMRPRLLRALSALSCCIIALLGVAALVLWGAGPFFLAAFLAMTAALFAKASRP